MNNLTTRKIVLGLLMTLVLAFSVQGTADAVSVSVSANIPGSAPRVSTIEVRSGQEFEITLTVGLQGRTRIRNSAGKYMDDGTFSSDVNLVDSSGYIINENGHRTLDSAGQNYVGDQGDTDTGYPLMVRDTNGAYISPTGKYFSNSSRSVYDSAGFPVYPYRAKAAGVTADRKSQAKALAIHWTKVEPQKKLYYYDEEQITVTPTATDPTINPTATTDNLSTDIMLSLENGLSVSGTALTEAISGEPKSAYDLTRSVTLICTATEDGFIGVRNTTPKSDYPPNAVEIQTGVSNLLASFKILVLPPQQSKTIL